MGEGEEERVESEAVDVNRGVEGEDGEEESESKSVAGIVIG